MNGARSRAGYAYRYFTRDSLHRNSTFLILSQGMNAGSAFLFWMIWARRSSVQTVGLATALISLGALAASFTHLGLPTTVIRFLPTSRHKAGLLGASLMVVTVMSLVGAAVTVAIVGIVAPDLSIVRSSVALTVLLVLLIVGNSLNPLLDNATMAFKKGQYIVVKAMVIGVLRILLPLVMVTGTLREVVASYVGLIVVSVIFGLTVVKARLFRSQRLTPRLREIVTHRSFAANNYLGGMVGILPSTLVPIVVLNSLGAAQVAFLYIPMQLATFLGIISGSASQVLISEAAQHDRPDVHAQQLVRSARHLFALLVPAATATAVFGWFVLKIYGDAYATPGYAPLVILCAASLFVGANWIGDTWLIVKRRMIAFVLMNTVNSLLVVGSVLILSGHGLVWAATGWLLGQVASAVIYAMIFARDQLRWRAVRARTSA